MLMSNTAAGTVDPEARARQSRGISAGAIYEMVARALDERDVSGDVIVDVGCGTGNLWPSVNARFDRYVGVDLVRYEGFPADAEFRKVDLDTGRIDLPDGRADVVVAVETIEHLENPRAFMRELARLTKPGGWVIVTTPNQLSLLSKITLLVKNQFNSFQEAPGLYPAHLTALLEIDLIRIATECGLVDVGTDFSHHGRIPLGPWYYPTSLSQRFPRPLSDNILLAAKKPSA